MAKPIEEAFREQDRLLISDEELIELRLKFLEDHIAQIFKGQPSKVCSCGQKIWMLRDLQHQSRPFDKYGNNRFAI